MSTKPFHVMAKPSGSNCNLRCAYCFYLEKKAFYPAKVPLRMNQEVLEGYVRKYIAENPPDQPVEFVWQGGEPALLGLDFYRRAVELQKRHGAGRAIGNSFQTNGTLLDEAWCDFFRENDFLVGLSLDGPDHIHDQFRRTAGDGDSHAPVMRTLHLLKNRGVRFNIMAAVNRQSARMPLRVYEFLREAGGEYIQFLPVVERTPSSRDDGEGLTLHRPPWVVPAGDGEAADPGRVTEWSVGGLEYGRFLTDIFDLWVKRDVGKVFVMNFEWALANFLGRPGTVCSHQAVCGRSVVVEHNGDVYACDHYVYPEYRLGNVLENSFAEMLDSPGQIGFGTHKRKGLTRQCRECPVLPGCQGGCMKHRFALSDDGEAGHNYLCAGFKHFFSHLPPYLKIIATLITNGRPASDIMSLRLVKGGVAQRQG